MQLNLNSINSSIDLDYLPADIQIRSGARFYIRGLCRTEFALRTVSRPQKVSDEMDGLFL